MALTAMTKTIALVAPATQRSTAQAVSFDVTGMSASVAVRISSETRMTAAERTKAGRTIPASAPTRYPR